MSLKNILLHEIISQSLTDTENKLVVTIGERNGGHGGQHRGKGLRGTIKYKISYKGILYNTGNISYTCNLYNIVH